MFQIHAPYEIEGGWLNRRDEIQAAMLAKWQQGRSQHQSPENIVATSMEDPEEIEIRFPQMRRGSIKHGDYGPLQMGCFRPNQDCSGTDTPIEGLYTCGASTYPGGLVLGGPGYLGANKVADDLGVARWWKPTPDDGAVHQGLSRGVSALGHRSFAGPITGAAFERRPGMADGSYDAIVMGAGFGGSSCAGLLAKRGLEGPAGREELHRRRQGHEPLEARLHLHGLGGDRRARRGQSLRGGAGRAGGGRSRHAGGAGTTAAASTRLPAASSSACPIRPSEHLDPNADLRLAGDRAGRSAGRRSSSSPT